MIVALILADKVRPLIDDTPPFLLPLNSETALERVASVVLRGPFGGTIVATDAACSDDAREALSGFAVQHVALPASAATGSIAALAPALKFAEDFRARWEKAMAAAAARFKDSDDDDDDDDGTSDDEGRRSNEQKQPRGKNRGRSARTSSAPQAAGDWQKHSKNADVKVRGLARSFERDGVMLFRAECPLIKPELQAQLVEAFAREGADKRDHARPIAQTVHQGVRAYPVLFDRHLIGELSALPATTRFDDWLLEQLKRTQDVPIQDGSALESLASDADYERIRELCE